MFEYTYSEHEKSTHQRDQLWTLQLKRISLGKRVDLKENNHMFHLFGFKPFFSQHKRTEGKKRKLSKQQTN